MRRRAFLATMGLLAAAAAVRTAAGAPLGGVLTRLTMPGAGDNRATYLPDGSAILFASRRTGRSQLWQMAPDGRQPARLHVSAANDFGRVAPSPDGSRLVFSSDRTGENLIYVLDRLSGAVTAISDPASWSFGPSWSSRDRIAYFSRRGGNGLNLWTVAPDGSDERQLTDQPGESRQPWWSPDGGTLAYSADRGAGKFMLRLVAASGADDHALTSTGDWQQPFWSPDGRRLAVSARLGDGHFRIVVMTVSGAAPRQIEQPDGDNVHPAWSPDGRSILFTAGQGDRGALWRFDFPR